MTIKQKVLYGLLAILLLVGITGIGYNDSGNREVITAPGGKQWVRYKPGIYYAMPGSTVQTWPNNITIASTASEASDHVDDDNVMELGPDSITFGLDGSVAYVKSVVQFELPMDEDQMIFINNYHKSPEGLCRRRLAPYTKTCLQSCGQLLSAESHYSGGKALMISEYKDQLANGIYILAPHDTVFKDTLEGTERKALIYTKQWNSKGKLVRDYSSILAVGITLGDATITDVRYGAVVMDRIKRKQASAAEAAISRQDLITAEQRRLTAKAQGEQRLTEIEYKQRQLQTIKVVEAQTLVEVAKQDLAKQEIARQAAVKEAEKIKTLADAKAYEKKRIMEADGGLELKAATWLKAQEAWAVAFGAYSGALVPTYMIAGRDGTSNTNAGLQFMEVMAANAAKDLMFNPKATK